MLLKAGHAAGNESFLALTLFCQGEKNDLVSYQND